MNLYVGKNNDKEFLAVVLARKEISPEVIGEEVFSYMGNDIPLLETADHEIHYYQYDNLDMVRETVVKALKVEKQPGYGRESKMCSPVSAEKDSVGGG